MLVIVNGAGIDEEVDEEVDEEEGLNLNIS